MKEIEEQTKIEDRILLIRGQKVMLDRDLAELYGVETKHLNRQVRRNIERFPEEFMFQLNKEEKSELVTNWHRFKPMKHSAHPPFAFTEHGVAMLANVLRSERAIKISVAIVQTFVRLRKWVLTHQEYVLKLKELEQKIEGHDIQIRKIFKAIRELMMPPEKPKREIGFHVR